MVSFAGSEMSFTVRESGELVVLSVASQSSWSFSVSLVRRAGRFQFVSHASWQFCSSRVRRAGSFAIRELGELAVLQVAS